MSDVFECFDPHQMVAGHKLPAARDLGSGGICMSTLPPTDANVTHENPSPGHHKVTFTVRRDGANTSQDRAWQGDGSTQTDATRDALKKMLSDPVAAEYISEKKT